MDATENVQEADKVKPSNQQVITIICYNCVKYRIKSMHLYLDTSNGIHNLCIFLSYY